MDLVTGGTGFLGSYIVKYLLGEGRKVRVLKRTESDTTLLSGYLDAIEFIDGDVLDILSLDEAMQGVEHVYHSAAVVSFNPKLRHQLYKTNVEGTANVVNAALKADVKKLLHVSSIAALGRPQPDVLIDETIKWEKSPFNSHYAISKHLAEKEVWRGIAEGLSAVIINPSLIIGAGFWHSGTASIFNKLHNGLKFYTRGGNGFVDVRDVALAAIRLMESDIANERFIISSENQTFKTFSHLVADSLNCKKPGIELQYSWGALIVPLLLFFGRLRNEEPLLTKETLYTSSHNFLYDNRKYLNLNLTSFRTLEQMVEETAAVFVECRGKNLKAATLQL